MADHSLPRGAARGLVSPAAVAARLDRLPFGRFHRRFLALIALGAWFDLYDNFVAGTLTVSLQAAGVLRPAGPGDLISDVGLFMASLSLGMFLGTIVFGLASDYVGRRVGFIAMLLLYSLATLFGGVGYYPLVYVAGATAGLLLLLLSRLAAGAGIGAENVVIDAYVSEVMPRQHRGRAMAIVQAIGFSAYPVAALLTRLLASKESPHGWRWLMVIGSLGALFSWHFRRRLPESPRWSAMHGRSEEATAALADIETAVEKESGPLPPPIVQEELDGQRRQPWHVIWSPQYRGRTVMLVLFHLLQTISYYGFIHWLGQYFISKGFEQNQALTMQFWSAFLAPLGPLLGYWAVERFQRKRLIVCLALALAALQLGFGWATGELTLIALGAAIVVCCNGFSAVFHAYQAELFPTEARATGIGFTYAWSRASMVGVSLLMPYLIAHRPGWPYGVMAGAMFGVAAVVGLFGPLTNNRSLEDVSPRAVESVSG